MKAICMFQVNNILILNYSNFIPVLFIPALEYCSIWGSSPYTSLLDRVESKAIRLIGDPSLTSTLEPLSLCRKVASLSLFYRYYLGRCSDELAACIPPSMAWPRSTWQATFAHNYCVWNSPMRELTVQWWFLPLYFPPLELSPFRISTFLQKAGLWPLGDQMTFFFITLLRYFIKLFYSFSLPIFSFSQGMQTRERAHCACSVLPFIKK